MDNPAGDLWIIIPNWDKFQHYKDREPVWIKLYLELRSRDEWRHLTLAERGLLVCIWIEYGASKCRIRTSDVTARVAQRVPKRALDSLAAAGFIQFSASAVLDQTEKSVATQQTETVDSALSLSIKQAPDPTPAGKLLAEIRDADGRTAAALHTLEHRLPDAAFAAALESLHHRRNGTKPLVSEARYVVAALVTMEREHRYE